MSIHVMVAEDEAKIAALLVDYLTAAGMRTSVVADGADVVSRVDSERPDLLLLDLMLPRRDGVDICRELRATRPLPIIMLTARIEEIDRLQGLDAGADDYICKPFSPREVVARVRAVLRRYDDRVDDADVPRVRVDEHRMRVEINRRPVDLTPVEFRLFSVLQRQPGRVWRREELLDRIYDDFRDISDRTVDSHVKNLRRKLLQVAPEARFIHAVYGVGYRFDPS